MGGSLEAFKLFNQRYSANPTQPSSTEASTASKETPLELRQKMAADAAAATSTSSSANDSSDAMPSSPSTSTSSVEAKEQVEDTRTEMQKRVATLYGNGRKGRGSVGSLH